MKYLLYNMDKKMYLAGYGSVLCMLHPEKDKALVFNSYKQVNRFMFEFMIDEHEYKLVDHSYSGPMS